MSNNITQPIFLEIVYPFKWYDLGARGYRSLHLHFILFNRFQLLTFTNLPLQFTLTLLHILTMRLFIVIIVKMCR